MIKLHAVENEVELSFLISLLEEASIGYWVDNDHFSTVFMGSMITPVSSKTIYVAEEDLQRAGEIIGDYLGKTAPAQDAPGHNYSWADKLRMVVEFIISGRFVRGRRWKRKQDRGHRTG